MAVAKICAKNSAHENTSRAPCLTAVYLSVQLVPVARTGVLAAVAVAVAVASPSRRRRLFRSCVMSDVEKPFMAAIYSVCLCQPVAGIRPFSFDACSDLRWPLMYSTSA